MKVLNLYCGIGSNRKLWENVEVTAIEINPEIANIYKDIFPDDNIFLNMILSGLVHHVKAIPNLEKM